MTTTETKLDANREKLLRDAQNKVTQAVTGLIIGRDAKSVYFATVIMRLNTVFTFDIDTACTDGRMIAYSPEFLATLTRGQMMFLVAHECMHVTGAHGARMGDRDPRQWNIACDLTINDILVECGFEFIECGVRPGVGIYANLPRGETPEFYYAHLPEDAKGAKGGDDPGKCGGVKKPGKGSPAECRKAEVEAREMAAAAANAVKASGRGSLPGSLDANVKQILEPKVRWQDVLREFVTKFAKNDYSWSRLNRRYVHRGIYLPGLHSEELGKIVLLVDLSGSTRPYWETFAGEMNGILATFPNCELIIGYHDVPIVKSETWTTTDGPLTINCRAGGGTSHIPAFKWVLENHPDAVGIVCLTDMETSFPSDPGIPTLWCVVGNHPGNAPFGRSVKVEDNK